MQIEIDSILHGHAQPDVLQWVPPELRGFTLRGAPSYGPFWSCEIGFTILQCMQFEAWSAAADGEQHSILLPHKDTGVMTLYQCFVLLPRPRLNVRDPCFAAMAGADITLWHIYVGGPGFGSYI
jgi:hypothetical protein